MVKQSHKENRWINNKNHCLSKALVQSARPNSLFVLEDLTNIRRATERVKHQNRYLMVSWSFYDLGQKIEYKAKRAGIKVITVSPKYTSQRCPKCGHIHSNNRDKKNHIFRCKECGFMSNDDRVGAMNLDYIGGMYKSAKSAEGRDHICALGLQSISPRCNDSSTEKKSNKGRRPKGRNTTDQLQTNRL